MIKEMEIIDYNNNDGLQLIWDKNFEISVTVNGKEVEIKANNSGLLSLARHLITLAQNNVPDGSHFHLDEYNSLETGSSDLIISKISNMK